MLAIDNNQIDNSKLLNRLVPKKRNENDYKISDAFLFKIYFKGCYNDYWPSYRGQFNYSSVLFRDDREEFLHELARDNTQLLINSIWGLPTERVEEVVVAKFPPPTYILPREKPVPVPKPLTKWEKYAKDKGNLKLLAFSFVNIFSKINSYPPQFWTFFSQTLNMIKSIYFFVKVLKKNVTCLFIFSFFLFFLPNHPLLSPRGWG